MKKILGLISIILIASTVQAQSCNTSYGNVFTPAQSSKLCSVFGDGKQVLDNNTYLSARNAANSADVPLLRLDSGNNTVLTSNTSNGIFLVPRQDLNRYLKYDAASDTAMTLQFGDGTTTTQQLAISGATTDGADDARFFLGAGGAAGDSTRGSWDLYNGNEQGSTPGERQINSGNISTADVVVKAQDDFIVETLAGTDALVIDTATGAASFPGTGSIGWTVTTIQANTACSTRCTNAAVLGFGLTTDSAFPITSFVDGSSATADICLCAGGS